MEYLEKEAVYDLLRCPICSGKSINIDKTKTINPDSDEMLDLKQCTSCYHWWISPMPKQSYLIELYTSGSEFVVSKEYQGAEKFEERYLLKYVSRFINNTDNLKNKNYLEIGVGAGQVFQYFKERTSISYGIEPGGWKPNTENIYPELSELPKNLKFDIIIIQDVLEHLENPMDMLHKVYTLSNKGALLCCGFPNKDAFIAKNLKSKWSMIRPIGHLHFFSARSINVMLKKTNWILLKKKNCQSAPSLNYYFLKVIREHKNLIKLFYRLLTEFLFKQVFFGKDQWYIKCIKQ